MPELDPFDQESSNAAERLTHRLKQMIDQTGVIRRDGDTGDPTFPSGVVTLGTGRIGKGTSEPRADDPKWTGLGGMIPKRETSGAGDGFHRWSGQAGLHR